MNDGRQQALDELLAPLREGPTGSLSIDQDRVVARMRGVAKDAPRERRQTRVAWFTSVAALALVCGLGAVRWARSPAASSLTVLALGGEVTWRGVPLLADQSAGMPAAGELATAHSGQARVRAGSGVEIELETDTRVGLDGLAGRRASVRLLDGKVRCRVPRLGADDAFSVVTRDVYVVVHGASFTVETAREGTTSVRVDQGVAVVHDPSQPSDDVTLGATQSWTNQRRPEPPPSPPALSPPPERTTVVSPTRAPRGTLARETRLLRSGLADERSGDLAGATASLDRLLARFPQSPLAPDARAALARVRSRQRAAP